MLLSTLHERELYPKFEIPPKLRLDYFDFKLIQQTTSYGLFEAKCRNSDALHMIRVLDPTVEFVSNNYDFAATLFIQELLRLHSLIPDAVFINTFEISSNGKSMAYASRPYYSLKFESDQCDQLRECSKNPNIIENLIRDVICDIEFLRKDLQLTNIMDSLGLESIYFMQDKKTFFVGNWTKLYEAEMDNSALNSNYLTSMSMISDPKITSQVLSRELKKVAYAALEWKEIDYAELEVIKIPKAYDFAVKAMLSDILEESDQLYLLLKRLLSLDPQNLPTLQELKESEESRRRRNDLQSKDSLKKTNETMSKKCTPLILFIS